MTWSSTRKGVTKISESPRDWTFHPQTSRQTKSRETLKTQNLKNTYKYFSWLGHWPASEQRKISVWAHDWDMRLDQPATESPEQGNIVFEIFDIFAKTKGFPETSKTFKNIFVFDQQRLSMWKHI